MEEFYFGFLSEEFGEEKNAEKDRKSTEKTKRKLQESGLEKAFKGRDRVYILLTPYLMIRM